MIRGRRYDDIEELESGYYMMDHYFRVNAKDEILLNSQNLQREDPIRVTRVEDFFLDKIKDMFDDDNHPLIVALSVASIEGLGLPEECNVYFVNRMCFFAFIVAYFNDGDLEVYYQMGILAGKHEDDPLVMMVRELIYLMLLRLDTTVRCKIYARVDVKYKQLLQHLDPIHTANPLISTRRVLSRCFRIVDEDDDADYDDDEPLFVNTHNKTAGESAPTVRQWKMKTAQKLVTKGQAWMKEENAEFKETYICAVIELTMRTSSDLPEFLLSGDARHVDTLDLINRLVLNIPYIVRSPELLIYKIMKMYTIITLTNPRIDPSRADGLYVYISFFTLTHLTLCASDIADRLAMESNSNNKRVF